jgi:hypothetical protein
MKTKFYLLIVLLFCLSNLGYSQTGIGTYSVHDGGFENHTANLAGGNASNAALSTSLWTASTTANVVRTSSSTGGRSGARYVTLGSTNGTAKNFYTPQIAGAFAPSTTYQVQFWYKTASTTALDASSVDIYVNNTSATQAPPIGTVKSVAAGLTTSVSTWTKVAVSITTPATPAAGNFGVAGITIDAATAGYSADIDDFVVYQANSADTDNSNTPGTITAAAASSSTASVSWGAASSVDGGGYMVVRYATTAPSASDDPIQNGIYKFASTIGAGVVRYIGSSTSFTDTSLSAGVDYYYKVYTVDKAFNYSSESTTSSPVQALATTYYYDGTGPLTDITNWGTNTNGAGTNPANFTDIAQVFEIRNTTDVTLDGSWTVGTDPTNGTKVRLGNTDQAAITLTLNSGASILPAGTGNFDVLAPTSGKQTVIYKGTTAISFGNIFDTNLEVIYDAVTISSTTTKSFGTVTIKNGANVTFTSKPIIKNISVDQSSTLIAPTAANSYITIPATGSVVIYGTVKIPKLTGFVSSGTTPSDAGGDFQFIGAEGLTLESNSIVEYARDATGAQTVTARTDYKNVTLSGTSPKSIAGTTAISGTFTINQTGSSLVTLNADTTVNGTLLFTNGKVNTGSNSLILGSSANISGASASSGWVIGNLRKITSSGASPSFTYTIGDANYYTPLALTFSNNTSATGTLTAKTASGDHAQIASSGITASNSINRTWTLTNSNLAGLSTYNASFTYATQDNDSNALPQFFASRLYNGASWTNLTTSGTPTTTSFAASSISGFGDFAIGQVCINPTSGGTIAGTQTFCSPANPAAFTNSASPSGQTGTLEYQWQSSTNNINFTDIDGAIAITYNAPSGLTTTTYYRRLARVSCQSDWTGAAESNVITVTVNPVLTPTFTQVNPICFGGTLSALPTTSTNSISGSWSPAINSAATTLYTFTPSDQCSLSTTMTIVVNRSLAGTISANQTITWSAQPDDITLTNSAGAVQWQSSTNNSSFTNIVGAPNSPTLDGALIGALTANKYFRAIVNDGGCGNVTSGTVAVTIITTTKIKDAYCGTTLPAINTQIQAELYPSAQLYRYHVSKNGTLLGTYEVNKNNFDLLKIAGTAYGMTYSIKVAVKINNVWGAYGTSCNVTTPTITSTNNIPVTSMRASQCGTILATIGSPIHSELVYAAEAYRFQMTNGTTVTEVESPIYYFFLTNTAIGTYGTTFSVKTKAKIAGIWGNYGSACSISTPALVANSVPTTQLMSSFCDATLAALNTKIAAKTVYNADAYRFKIVKGDVETIYVSNFYNFRLSDAGIVATNGTTYAISVAARVNGTFGNYGASCNVTTPGSASNSRQIVENTDFNLVAYPNPSNGAFKLQVNGSNNETISVLVFDMTGRQIENKVVQSNEIENISLGQNYSTGIYNVIVSQGMNTKTVRLVKN